MRTPLLVVLASLSLTFSCGGGADGTDAKAASGDEAAGAGDGRAADGPDATKGGGDKPAADASAVASGAASAAPSAAPSAAAKETAKDDNALVLELQFMMKGGGKLDSATSTVLKQAAQERLGKSSKMGGPESKVKNPRRVIVTVLLEEPTNSAKGLNVKMGLVGVEQNGKCPLFDLDQNFTMSGAKSDSAKDVLELRSAAITALLDKLEVTAPTLKPAANCTTYKDKK